MARAPRRPVLDAVVAVLEAISVGGANTMKVGDGTDPNHERPYLVVTTIPGGRYEGPLDDTNADADIRIQVTGIGDTREQADWACDKAKAALTKAALDTELAGDSRKVLTVDLVLEFGARDERGMTQPTFVGFDQYQIATTPL